MTGYGMGRGVQAAAVIAQSDTFAANRAVGGVTLSVKAERGRTRRARVHEHGSLRVRFPTAVADECEAVLVNSAGGMTGGDRFDLDVAVGRDARLMVTGAAAEKVYRSTGSDAEISVRLDVAAGGMLRWLPQETILFDRARMARRIDVELAGDASILIAEAVVFGRSAMGESVQQGKFVDRWRVRRDGRLMFAETLRLDGAIAETLGAAAAANGGTAIATILMAPGDEKAVAAMRACEFSGEVGISCWNGSALARLCARDDATLRRDLVAALAAMSQHPLPHLWLN